MVAKVKLVALDFDGVLSNTTQIIELAKVNQVLPEIQYLIEAWQSETYSLAEAHIAAVRQLRGLEKENLDVAKNNLHLVAGADITIKSLVESGVVVIVISNGYTQLCGEVAYRLGVNKVFANILKWDHTGTKLSGDMMPLVIDAESKARVLRKVRNSLRLTVANCAAVGNDINDIPMLQEAGLRIFFRPERSQLASYADTIIEQNLQELIPILSSKR